MGLADDSEGGKEGRGEFGVAEDFGLCAGLFRGDTFGEEAPSRFGGNLNGGVRRGSRSCGKLPAVQFLERPGGAGGFDLEGGAGWGVDGAVAMWEGAEERVENGQGVG